MPILLEARQAKTAKLNLNRESHAYEATEFQVQKQFCQDAAEKTGESSHIYDVVVCQNTLPDHHESTLCERSGVDSRLVRRASIAKIKST